MTHQILRIIDEKPFQKSFSDSEDESIFMMLVGRQPQIQVYNLPAKKNYRQNTHHTISNLQQNHETYTKKSQNTSERKSLLTEILKASSEKSYSETIEEEFMSQVILRPRVQDYSHDEDRRIDEDLKKFSLQSVRMSGKSKEKIITDILNQAAEESKENILMPKKKQIKLRKSEINCSRCEIF